MRNSGKCERHTILVYAQLEENLITYEGAELKTINK